MPASKVCPLAHHRCAHPIRHASLTLGVAVCWTLLVLIVGPVAVQALTHSATWLWGGLLLALWPGSVVLQTLLRWRCQPMPSPWGKGTAFAAGYLLGRFL